MERTKNDAQPLTFFDEIGKKSKKLRKSRKQGYCVLLGSCVRSVPQIIKIVQNKSVEGLSLAANGAELLAYSITFAYNWR